MLRRLLSLVLLAVVAALPAAAQAKIGYADADLILQAMPQVVQVRQTLQGEFTQRQQALQTQANELRTKADDYQRRQSLLTPEARQAAEQELAALQQALEAASQAAEQTLRRREVELMQPLYESLQNAINAEAEAKGVDVVLPTRVQNEPLLLFVNRNTVVDLTRDIAVRLGINPDAPVTAPAAGAPAGGAARPAAAPARPAAAPAPARPRRNN